MDLKLKKLIGLDQMVYFLVDVFDFIKKGFLDVAVLRYVYLSVGIQSVSLLSMVCILLVLGLSVGSSKHHLDCLVVDGAHGLALRLLTNIHISLF